MVQETLENARETMATMNRSVLASRSVTESRTITGNRDRVREAYWKRSRHLGRVVFGGRGWSVVSERGVVSLREGSRLTRSCVGTAAVSVEMEGELGRGDAGLLDAGMDEGAGSERRRVEASAKSKSEL